MSEENWGGGTLDTALRDLRRFAGGVFARDPELRSILVCVAQYWNDEADDAVHATVIGSVRRAPLWPHVCSESLYADEESTVDPEVIDGESCRDCGFGDSFPCDDNGSSIPVFAPYCHEHGSQEESIRNNYTPFMIARRAGDDIEIEFVGTLHRPDLLDVAQRKAARQRAKPFDDRAMELFHQVCANAADDGPRRVLADYLIEHDDPRGEYISLSLSELDEDGRARRDALLEEHRWSWVHPLGAVIPRAHAQFERGLLAGADVEVAHDELATIQDAIAWGSVKRLHFLPRSAAFVSPAMRALRDVGPLGSTGLAQLANGTWAIEHLRVFLTTPTDDDHLIAARLPTLRHLSFELASGTEYGPPYAKLPTASWWSHVERVTWLRDLEGSQPWLASLSAIAPVPWIAVSDVGADGKPAGWNVAMSRDAIEVTMRGWTRTSTRETLVALLVSLPELPITLRSSTTWEPIADDVAALAAAGRRAVII